ncbi:MAG: hypothetical protein HND53_08210 [Proteobacteria bacterium]|nr:hypothetical protein [Pseudomonadota bacterium]NOG60466.1 hypothetical protein [Pseudomonadota bacterium]
MKNVFKVFLLLISSLIFTACSDDSNSFAEAKKDHVWKGQTDTIDKAKEVEGMLTESVENTRKALEEQSQ